MTNLFENVSLWETLGWTMLHFCWLGCLVFAAAAGVRTAVRRSLPAVRYAASLTCLLAVALSAAAAFWISVRQIDNAVAASVPDPVRASIPAVETPTFYLSGTRRDAVSPIVATPPFDRPPAEALRHEVVQGALKTCAEVLPWLWICGTPVVAFVLVAGIAGTTRLRRGATPVDDGPLLQQLQRLRSLLGISRRVGIAVCDQVSSPLVIGIVRPLIVLPPAIVSGLAPAQLEMILLHELAHVRRWDNLVNLIQRTVEALLFYHPVTWWVSRWVRLEREHCCDALVLSRDHAPQAYAETLATLALPELSPQFATAAMANHQLTSRICHILNVEERTMTVSRRTLVGGIVLLAAGVGGFLLATLRTERAIADDSAEQLTPVSEELESDRIGRLMLGIGVNSDAGVLGHVVFDEGTDSLAGSEAGGGPVGTSLEKWGRRGWSASEATGPPDVSEAGDSPQAWASLTEDGQAEWLRVTFEKPVPTAAIMVYESFNPGALVRVTTTMNDNDEGEVIWEGSDPVSVRDGKGVAMIIPDQLRELHSITLHFDSPSVAGWNEIDAVGLIDRTTAEVHWAVSADASSSYADREAWTQADYYHHFLGGLNDAQRCEACHVNAHGSAVAPPGSTRQRIEQLRSELQRLEWELLVQELVNSPDAAEVGPELDADVNRAWAELLRRAPDTLRMPTFEMDPSEVRTLQEWINAGREWEPSANDPDSAGPGTQGEAEQPQVQTAAEAYRDWVLRLLNDPDAGAPESTIGLEELRSTLIEQQQAIERLTEMLEQLRQRLDPPADSPDARSDRDGDDLGTRIQTPGVGPAPAVLDFGFPLEPNVIDELIRQRLNDAGVSEAEEDSDVEFIRRVYLDLLGVPLSDEDVREHLEQLESTSRNEWIENVLQSESVNDNQSEAFRFYYGLQR